MSQLHVHHVEGAVARVRDADTAFGKRDSRYIVNTIGMWMDPAFRDGETANDALDRGSDARVLPRRRLPQLLDADEGDERIRAAYGPDKYERLVALKDRYDPDNVFRLKPEHQALGGPPNFARGSRGARARQRAPPELLGGRHAVANRAQHRLRRVGERAEDLRAFEQRLPGSGAALAFRCAAE